MRITQPSDPLYADDRNFYKVEKWALRNRPQNAA
jgi:hypothetical protein